MNRSWKVFQGLLAAIGLLAVICGALFLAGGISARQLPGAAETRVARALRHRLIPPGARRRSNPFVASPAILDESRSHFADHCASCHGNDGRGRTEIGQRLYPRAPDMTRPATQSLSDGELFFIIKNGVRLTGMPAWGNDTLEDDQASWKLVAFVRHLPALTAAEFEQMKAENPVNPAEAREAKETSDFLEGDDTESNPVERRPKHTH